MSWRAQDLYEQAERERIRKRLALLEPQNRVRYLALQASGMGIFVCIVALFAWMAVR